MVRLIEECEDHYSSAKVVTYKWRETNGLIQHNALAGGRYHARDFSGSDGKYPASHGPKPVVVHPIDNSSY
jgi:hypothetical protein